jgi:acetyltransferase-like isoleucine patch superfamily enzyme
VIHTTADVQSKNIGTKTTIWQYCVVLPGAEIGIGCNINAHCFIENDVKIGNYVTVKAGVYLWDGITIEDYVQIGPNVSFTNDIYPRAKQVFKVRKTLIENGSSIGAGSTIIGGITIGSFALIGAGSVVTKDVANNTLCYGNPAIFKGYVCNCGNKLSNDLICRTCGKIYKLDDNKIMLKDD